MIDDFSMLRVQGHDVGAFAYSDVGINMLGEGMIAKNSTLQSSPDMVRALVQGFVQSVAITRQDPKEAARITKTLNPHAPEPQFLAATIEAVMKRMSTKNSAGKPMGFMARPDWQSTLDVLTEGGLVRKLKWMLASLYTNKFLST